MHIHARARAHHHFLSWCYLARAPLASRVVVTQQKLETRRKEGKKERKKKPWQNSSLWNPRHRASSALYDRLYGDRRLRREDPSAARGKDQRVEKKKKPLTTAADPTLLWNGAEKSSASDAAPTGGDSGAPWRRRRMASSRPSWIRGASGRVLRLCTRISSWGWWSERRREKCPGSSTTAARKWRKMMFWRQSLRKSGSWTNLLVTTWKWSRDTGDMTSLPSGRSFWPKSRQPFVSPTEWRDRQKCFRRKWWGKKRDYCNLWFW